MVSRLNPSQFNPYNVVDACSIWNILSSKRLYEASISVVAKCNFCCTNFVYYECMIKTRNNRTQEESELQECLRAERKHREQFKDYHLNIEDLQEVEALEKRRNLGKGELTSIIFAKKTRQAFMTDDKGARELAGQVITDGKVQTTPHLLGWLFYQNILIDSDKETIIEEHSKFRKEKRGNLSKFFNEMYNRAYEYQLMNRCSK